MNGRSPRPKKSAYKVSDAIPIRDITGYSHLGTTDHAFTRKSCTSGRRQVAALPAMPPPLSLVRASAQANSSPRGRTWPRTCPNLRQFDGGGRVWPSKPAGLAARHAGRPATGLQHFCCRPEIPALPIHFALWDNGRPEFRDSIVFWLVFTINFNILSFLLRLTLYQLRLLFLAIIARSRKAGIGNHFQVKQPQ